MPGGKTADQLMRVGGVKDIRSSLLNSRIEQQGKSGERGGTPGCSESQNCEIAGIKYLEI